MSDPPFWEHLAEQGLTVAAIDVPKSPIGGASGSLVVADWMCHGPDGTSVVLSPVAETHPVSARFVGDPTFDCDAPHRTEADTARFERQLRERAAARADALLQLLGGQRWDLFLAVFAETHCVGHQRRDDAVVERVYRDVDEHLARLIERAGPDAIVIVFSLLGMGTNHTGEHLVGAVLEKLESGSVRRHRSAAADLTRWARQRTPRRFRRRAPQSLAQASKVASSSAHRYWVIPTDLPATAIRLNVVGREPRGVVRPGPEHAATCDELRRELLALRDPGTHRPLVRDVLLTRDAHPGPASDTLADLLVLWDQAGPITAATSPRVGLVEGAPPLLRSGNHRDGGWFVATGPGISPQRLSRLGSAVDFAATIDSLLERPHA